MATPLNIIGGWYSDESKPWAQQDICNYIPFAAEVAGTLSPIKAVDAPGLKPFVEIASDGGIRGAKNVEGKLLVVAGTTLYQISNTGVAIPRGAIPGTGLVSIDYNQQGIANQVLIGNGSAGYVYDTSALTLERITDPAFPGTKAVAYLDSYLLGVEPLGRFWFHSNLADATDYNSLDRYEAETAPDRIVTLEVSNEEVVVFGQSTTDFFVNTGEATGTFQSKGVSMDVGCAAAASVVKLDNTLFWLDNYGVFQRLNGYSPQPVSTRALETAISGFDWSRCRAMVYQDKGRKIVYWTFPGLLTIGYDVTTGLWHRRQAYGKASDRLSCIVNWNKLWIGGDYQSGRLYELDWDYMLQVDQPHVRRVHTMPLQANGNRLNLHRLKLQFDTGGPETIAIPFPEQPEPPAITGDAPNGFVGTEWGPYTYSATGGTAPYTFTLRPGSTVPAGLPTLTSAGVLPAGTPTTEAAYTVIVRVTDANGLWDELTDTINIGAIQIGLEWQYTGTFGNNATDICYGAEDELFLVCTQGLLAVGQVFTTPDSDVMTQRSSGVPAVSFDSCAWGKVAGQGRYVISQQSANVISTRGTVDAWAFTQYATDNANAYALTIHDGDNDGENGNGFIRAGLGGSSEHSATGIGGWASVSRPSGEDAICYTKMEWDNKRVVLIFGANGGIDRTEDGGLSYTTPLVADDPLAGANFGGAANDGTIIQAYKYSSGTLYTYTSIDGGHNFTVQSDVVGSSNYRAGKLLFRNGNWFGLGVTVTGGEQVELWCSPDGKVPWTDAQVQDYVDTYSATMVSIAASSERAILVGNKSDPTSSGYAMTSPVLTP